MEPAVEYPFGEFRMEFVRDAEKGTVSLVVDHVALMEWPSQEPPPSMAALTQIFRMIEVRG